METLTSASKFLLECSEKLEKNAVLLEEFRADSSSIQSLAAGVNYYASTTKASQASEPQQRRERQCHASQLKITIAWSSHTHQLPESARKPLKRGVQTQ